MRKVTTVRFLQFFACFFVRDVDFATLLNRDSTREMSFSNGHVLGFFLLLLLLLLSTLVF